MSSYVVVSGATGFIAQHVVDLLLKANYKVIGTARSEEKGDKLKKQFNNNPNLIMEVVKDISDLNAFDSLFEKYNTQIKIVLHTASPFHFDTTDFAKDLLIPAKNGTLGILNSIKKYSSKSVERVVVTSSFAAILNVSAKPNKDKIYTENDWNPDTFETGQVNALVAYCASKKIAEESAWNFVKENENSINFKLSTVNPVFVFGPQLFSENVSGTLNTSCEIINSILKNGKDGAITNDVGGEYIDVRDVAKAHIDAFEREDTIGKRLLMSEGQWSPQSIVNVINKDFPSLNGKIPASGPDTKVENKEGSYYLDNSSTKKLLGWKFITLDKCIKDTVAQIEEH